MSDPRVRRFSRFQIALHWSVGLPYIAQLLTGGLVMLHRAELLRWPAARFVEHLHRWIGIALVFVLLQALFAAAVTAQLVPLARGLLNWALLRRDDLIWLAKVPLNILAPRRFALPQVGRYNAGQKLHGLFITVALVVFSFTGVVMILHPADLRFWVLHAWFFYAACAFLALHLFLGLINPATRPALRGIFTGYVPRDYVRHHHPLELAEPAEPVPHAVVSIRALALTWLGALVLTAGLLWWYGPHLAAQRLLALKGHDHPAMSPGPLVAAHADDPRITSCSACHQSLHEPPDSACLACHREIATVMQEKRGFHGQLNGACHTCHPDHKGRDADIRGLDRRTFNHRLARFTLDGKHQSVDCDACHVRHSPQPGKLRFIGLSASACTDCHTNPHTELATQAGRATTCTHCHTERGWGRQELVFDHQRDTPFALEGRHATLDCEHCHDTRRATLVLAAARPRLPNPATAPVALTALRAILPPPATQPTQPASQGNLRLAGVGTQCADCHADPHRPALAAACRQCHTPAGWTGRDLAFRHDRDTRFPLEQAHAKVECQACHALPAAGAALAEARFARTATTCAGCHTDPHQKQFTQDCTACHLPTKWTGRDLRFVHDRDSKFPLRGQHESVDCGKCHQPPPGKPLAHATFKGLSTECSKCHQDPHDKQFTRSCSSCHSEQRWTGPALLFQHDRDSSFKLDALHRTVDCNACHQEIKTVRRYEGTPDRCNDCHQTIAQAMAGAIDGGQLPADPHDGRVKCADCHAPDVARPTPARYADACQRCHTPHYRGLYFDWQRSLDDKATAARDAIGRLRPTDPRRAAALYQRLEQARQIGPHNTQQAATLLTRITTEATTRPGPPAKPDAR